MKILAKGEVVKCKVIKCVALLQPRPYCQSWRYNNLV